MGGGILKCQLCSLKSILIKIRSQRVPRRMLSRRKYVWLRPVIINTVLVIASKHSLFCQGRKKKKCLRISRKPAKQNHIQCALPNIKHNKCNMMWNSLENKSAHLKQPSKHCSLNSTGFVIYKATFLSSQFQKLDYTVKT